MKAVAGGAPWQRPPGWAFGPAGQTFDRLSGRGIVRYITPPAASTAGDGRARRDVGYGYGAIRRRRQPNPNRGMREYHGPCEGGCGVTIHTLGDPPRKLCLACVRKRDEGPGLVITPAMAEAAAAVERAEAERAKAQAGGRA